MRSIKASKRNHTIIDFINACWGILQEARKKHGATVRELFEISQQVGAPKATFGAFQTAYYAVANGR